MGISTVSSPPTCCGSGITGSSREITEPFTRQYWLGCHPTKRRTISVSARQTLGLRRKSHLRCRRGRIAKRETPGLSGAVDLRLSFADLEIVGSVEFLCGSY